MKYKIKEFMKLLGEQNGAHHIYVKIDDTRDRYDRVLGLPARSPKFVQMCDGKAQLYISVNLCRMMTGKPKISDVLYWSCEYIDLDCKRVNNKIPATNKELEVLDQEIDDINNWLDKNGLKCGYFDFTGNGYRWLLPIPILNLQTMNIMDVMNLNNKKHEFLKIIKRETGTNIDTSVGELSRITGIPGTINLKARDGTDRRREQFRGCERDEDLNLRNYIINIELPENNTEIKVREFYGNATDIVNGLMINDKELRTKLQRAPLIKDGHRSEYDYSIALKLREMGVSVKNCIDILMQYGTTKVQGRVKYSKITAMNAYTSVNVEIK